MNRDIVKRLAIQSGIDLEFFQAGEVFSFATAIAKQAVEEYSMVYRIKPQPVEVVASGQPFRFKEKKYLYAYFDLLTGAVVFNTITQWSNANKNLELIGKIEVQDD